MKHPTLKLLEWLLDEPKENDMTEKSLFARLEADDSRSGHDRIAEAVRQRQFDHPDETYEQSLFSVIRIMPKTAADYHGQR